MKHCVAILLFLFAFYGQASPEAIDSLKKELPVLKGVARIDCLNALGGAYIGSPPKWFGTDTKYNFDTAELFVAEALKEAKKISYTYGIATATLLKAELVFDKYENYAEAEKLCRESIFLYKETANKKGLNKAYWRLGAALHAQSNFEESLKNYDTSYRLSKSAGDSLYVIYTIITAVYSYMERGDYDNAFEKVLMLHQLITAGSDVKWKAYEVELLSELYYEIRDYNTALKYLHQQLQLGDNCYQQLAQTFAQNNQLDSAAYYYKLVVVDTSDQRKLRFYLRDLGEYYLFYKKYREALAPLVRSLHYHKQAHDVNQVMQTLFPIAKAYLGLQKYDSAFWYAHRVFITAKQKDARQFIQDACEILSLIYDRWHQSDSAYFYYKQYSGMKDSVLNDRVKGKLGGFVFEQKIASLRQEKYIQQVQLQKQFLLKRILISGIIVSLLLALIVFRNISLKRRNEVHRRELIENEFRIQQLESQRQLSELQMQALRAQMNPHFIFNSLNSINRFILRNDKLQASHYLTKFSKLARHTLQNAQLSSITLEREFEALRLYLELEAVRLDHQFSYSISVADDIDVAAVKVPPLLIQPFAENAIWHGLMPKPEKGHLRIELFVEASALCCRIADDGVGRKQAAELKKNSITTHKSIGLEVTVNRIALLQQGQEPDNAVKVTDLVAPNGTPAGTEVFFKIPIVYD